MKGLESGKFGTRRTGKQCTGVTKYGTDGYRWHWVMSRAIRVVMAVVSEPKAIARVA